MRSIKMAIALIISACIFITNPIFSQSKYEKSLFNDAEYFFAMEDYSEALPLYIQLSKRSFKNNYNIMYKIGICYLNIPGEKIKAIEYLYKASMNINLNYKEGSIKETKAPVDVLLHLGNAYRVNNRLDEAIETYEKFITTTTNIKIDPIVINWAKTQIEACKRAKIALRNPIDVKITPVGKPIQVKGVMLHPVLTIDEKKMVYVVRQKFYDAIFYTQRANDQWNQPRNITTELRSDGNQYPVYISPDGKTILLSYIFGDNSDIYISQFQNKRWSSSVPLSKTINTKYWESHACMTADGNMLYFTSNRPGTIGGIDIFVSELLPNNQWSEPINLGQPINTSLNEETPFISPTGDTLYFSSQGHESIGGFDIFYSIKNEDGTWSDPINMGFPINTTDDDLFYFPISKTKGYQARYIPDLKSQNIVTLEIISTTQKDYTHDK